MNTGIGTGAARIAPESRIVASGTAAMVYDAALPVAPTLAWFDRAHWADQGTLREVAGGRGGVAFVETPVGECVLRHYRRGGRVAPLLGDRYLWRGRSRSRGFAEYYLLAELAARGLPVPAPIAARCVQSGMWYRADLLTRAIAGADTMANMIRAGRLDAELAMQMGGLVARFHAAGVDHADLNAHNILVTSERLWLIDFDRGELRETGTAWKLANLARLKRSLLKVGACGGDETVLEHAIWASLMRGYERAAAGR